MITYRKTTVVFILILCTLATMSFATSEVFLYYIIPLIIVYALFLLVISFFISSGFYMNIICRVKTSDKVVALTFDDGPDQDVTPLLLDKLHYSGTPATFFCIGKRIQGHVAILKRMVADGHLIGTHSYSHSWSFDFFSSSRMAEEMNLSARIVVEAIGTKPLMFRPPYGVINPAIKRALRQTKLHPVGFSNRAWDTTSNNPDKVRNRILNQVKPGDIILLHDTVQSNIQLVSDLIEDLNKSGFRIIPLDQLLDIHPYDL